MLIGIAGWAIVGAVVGFVCSKLVDLRGDDPRLGIALAGVGGVVGGWLYSLLSGSPVVFFNIWSLLCAGAAALLVAVAWHIVRSRGPHERPSIRRSY